MYTRRRLLSLLFITVDIHLFFLCIRRHLFHGPSRLKSQPSEKVKASCTNTAAWESSVSTRDTAVDPGSSTGDWWVCCDQSSYSSYAWKFRKYFEMCLFIITRFYRRDAGWSWKLSQISLPFGLHRNFLDSTPDLPGHSNCGFHRIGVEGRFSCVLVLKFKTFFYKSLY